MMYQPGTRASGPTRVVLSHPPPLESRSARAGEVIAKDNISEYDGHMEWDYDKNFIESWGEVKE